VALSSHGDQNGKRGRTCRTAALEGSDDDAGGGSRDSTDAPSPKSIPQSSPIPSSDTSGHRKRHRHDHLAPDIPDIPTQAVARGAMALRGKKKGRRVGRGRGRGTESEGLQRAMKIWERGESSMR